jgi:hypothetical protein
MHWTIATSRGNPHRQLAGRPSHRRCGGATLRAIAAPHLPPGDRETTAGSATPLAVLAFERPAQPPPASAFPR